MSNIYVEQGAVFRVFSLAFDIEAAMLEIATTDAPLHRVSVEDLKRSTTPLMRIYEDRLPKADTNHPGILGRFKMSEDQYIVMLIDGHHRLHNLLREGKRWMYCYLVDVEANTHRTHAFP